MASIINPTLRKSELTVHVIIWLIVFIFPYLLISRVADFGVSIMEYIETGIGDAVIILCAFYVNYLILIPKLFLNKGAGTYLAVALFTIFVLALGMEVWHHVNFTIFEKNVQQGPRFHYNPPFWTFIIRNMVSLAFITLISSTIRITKQYYKVESEREEADRKNTEAQLQNLKNQLNPHFLLNTLNNIYALIAFDGEKAQEAVQELSKLLRHVLYENKEELTTLDKEMEFMKSYIELMRIRIPSNVKVETLYNIKEESRTPIAPLIFISLVENAFKHGISSTENSFIKIYFSELNGNVRCEIRNSYFPKSISDKSGSGIGLEQVKKRLDLSYPGRYIWNKGVDEAQKEYYSILEIKTNKL